MKTIRVQPQLNLVHLPDTEYPHVPSLQFPAEINKTTSKLYPPSKPLRKPSTSLSNLSKYSPLTLNLSDDASEYIPSQESTSSLFVPHHRYNLRNLPSRTPNIDTSTLNFSTLSSNSALRLARQQAQPLSSDTPSSEFVPQSYFTSGLDTASLLSSDVQTEIPFRKPLFPGNHLPL